MLVTIEAVIYYTDTRGDCHGDGYLHLQLPLELGEL